MRGRFRRCITVSQTKSSSSLFCTQSVLCPRIYKAERLIRKRNSFTPLHLHRIFVSVSQKILCSTLGAMFSGLLLGKTLSPFLSTWVQVGCCKKLSLFTCASPDRPGPPSTPKSHKMIPRLIPESAPGRQGDCSHNDKQNR